MHTGETDIELENRARAQADAILRAHAASLAEAPPMAAFLGAVGNALGLGNKQAPLSAPAEVPKPGRELLLWLLREQHALPAAAGLVGELFTQPQFIATVPAERDCPLLSYQARRKWNDAAKQWTALRDPKARTWLECDRRLVLRRKGGTVELCVVRKDLDVQFDAKTQQLVPSRVESTEVVDLKAFDKVIELFPNLTVRLLADGLRSPAQYLHKPGQRAGSPDAYVANAPLFVSNMEVYMTDKKKKKDDKEDPNKGFVTWLSNTLKQSGAK